MEDVIKRRKLAIVDRSLQYKLLALIIVYSMTIVVFLAAFLFVPDIIDMMNKDLTLEVRGAAAHRILGLHARLWPAIITLVCLLGIHSVRFFHRLIGPLYRFRSAFAMVSEGDLSFRVKLRKKDHLFREEVAFNEMMDVIAEKWRNIQITVPEALKSLDAIEKSVAEMGGRQDTDQKLIDKHRQNLAALSEGVQYFRLNEQETP
jgi:hypothetical protein